MGKKEENARVRHTTYLPGANDDTDGDHHVQPRRKPTHHCCFFELALSPLLGVLGSKPFHPEVIVPFS